jgi:hypothetical protein
VDIAPSWRDGDAVGLRGRRAQDAHGRTHDTDTTQTHQPMPSPTLTTLQRPAAAPARAPRAATAPAAPVDVGAFERRLAARIGAARYRLWFGEPASVSISPAGVEIRVPNRYSAEWIERHYRADAQAIATDCGLPEVRITIDAPAGPAAAGSQRRRESGFRRRRRRRPGTDPRPRGPIPATLEPARRRLRRPPPRPQSSRRAGGGEQD